MEETTIFECGPREKCPDGTEHDYSGWEEGRDEETGSSWGSVVCAKCGHRSIDDAMWY